MPTLFVALSDRSELQGEQLVEARHGRTSESKATSTTTVMHEQKTAGSVLPEGSKAEFFLGDASHEAEVTSGFSTEGQYEQPSGEGSDDWTDDVG